MEIIRGKEVGQLTFEDLDEGETFTELGEDQIQVKTDEHSGCCLDDGTLYHHDDDTKVVRIACEVRVL